MCSPFWQQFLCGAGGVHLLSGLCALLPVHRVSWCAVGGAHHFLTRMAWPLLSAAALAAHGQLLSTALERPPSTALCAEWLSRGGRCSDANLRFSCMATCAQAERRRLLSAAAAISHVLTPPVGELPTGRHGDSRAKSSACPDSDPGCNQPERSALATSTNGAGDPRTKTSACPDLDPDCTQPEALAASPMPTASPIVPSADPPMQNGNT